MRRSRLALVLVLFACSTRAMPRTVPSTARTLPVDRRSIRVALPMTEPRVGATGTFGWYGSDGRTMLAESRAPDQWRVEREAGGVRLRAIRADGGAAATPWQRELYARPTGDGFLLVSGRRYRGELAALLVDGDVALVNRLGLEDYLRGVVPMEMGARPRGDSSALQAQAVASRSYALTRSADGAGAFDLRATTADQVYGGVEAETDAANDAIDATRGLVLRYQGRTVDAPFHSTCGGSTARPDEVWRSDSAPYLRSVSDRVPGSERDYCDIAPRYRWTRTLVAPELNAALAQYLRTYASVPPPTAGPGAARVIGVRSRTPSGRVGVLDIETDRGVFPLRGNDIRYVLRAPGGEILPSTYFSVEPEYRDGRVSRVTFRGQGYGHGVGMCQWGAIGRARAGQSFRVILGIYYPGTTVGADQ